MFTTTVKNYILNAVFGGNGGANLPTSYRVGLSTTTPKANGTNITEPSSASGYTRLNATFGIAADGKIQNSTTLEFPAFTQDAGVATHYVIFDQNGNPYWFEALARTRALEADTVLAFPVGGITISLVDSI